MSRLNHWVVTLPSMYVAWWIARGFTWGTRHPWRNAQGAWMMPFDSWCRCASPLLYELAGGIYASLLGVVAAGVILLCR